MPVGFTKKASAAKSRIKRVRKGTLSIQTGGDASGTVSEAPVTARVATRSESLAYALGTRGEGPFRPPRLGDVTPVMTALGLPSIVLSADITLTIYPPFVDEVALTKLAVSSMRHHLAVELYRHAPLLATFYEFDLKLAEWSDGSVKLTYQAALKFKDDVFKDLKKAGPVAGLTLALMFPSAIKDTVDMFRSMGNQTQAAVQKDVPQCRPTVTISNTYIYNVTTNTMTVAPQKQKSNATMAKKGKGTKPVKKAVGSAIAKKRAPSTTQTPATGARPNAPGVVKNPPAPTKRLDAPSVPFPRGGKSFDL